MSEYYPEDPQEHGAGERDGDNVVYLPAAHEADTPTVVTAELVDTEDASGERAPEHAGTPREGFNTRLIPHPARERMASGAVTVIRQARPVAATSSKTLARHAVHVAHGAQVVRGRWRDTHGAGRYERQMRAAELDGAHERLLEWEARDVAEKHQRHQRRMDWLDAPGKLIKAGLVALAGLAGFLLLLGGFVFVGTGDVADVIGPITAVIDAVAFTVWFVSATWVLLLIAAGVLGGVYLHRQGRQHGHTPTWLAAHTGESGPAPDATVDESMIMNALRNLGHTALNRKCKEGWGTSVQPTWVQPPLPMGDGWEFVLRLPGGVPASSINARKTVLAHNLGRRPEEVWVDTDDSDPMAMKCLVLDPGSLRKPVPEYPLLEGGQTDFWTGFAVGIDARRNPVTTPVFERNFVKSGTMGSGKSTLVQTELAGAVLDPVVDIDVFCFADNNDFEWLRPIAATLSMGDTPENVQACLEHIQALQQQLTLRGQLLRERNIDAVTRHAAESDPRLRPRFVVIDECQSLFRQDKPEDRREVVNLLVRFFSAARKYGIVLSFATPTPSDQSLPRDLVAVATNKSCFAIGDKTRNNVVLGEKAYENGLSALELKPAIKRGGTTVALNDVGTSVSIGYADQPGLLRSYNLTFEQKTAIVDRGLELRSGTTGQAITPQQPQQRDLLADVATVLRGDDKLRATDVVARLRQLAPQHPDYYQPFNATVLKSRLAGVGVNVTKVDGIPTVHTDRIRTMLAYRDGIDPNIGADTPHTGP